MTVQFSLAQVNNFNWRQQGFDWDNQEQQKLVFGIYAEAPTCYLSHLVRNPNFQFESLDKKLYQECTVVRIRAMRHTVFIVPVELLPSVFQATKDQALASEYKIRKLADLSDGEYIEISAAVEKLLGNQAMGIKQIKHSLPASLGGYRESLQYVVPFMCAQGRLVRATVNGGWRSNQYEYARMDKWLPDVNLDAVTPAQGQVNLARLYLDSYSPATLNDFKWWSGLKHDQVVTALAGLGNELVQVMVEGQECLMLETHLDSLAGTPDQPPEGLHLLPFLDAYLMAYRSRDRFLSPEHFDTIYDKSGNATNTLLVDGEAKGVWDLIEENNHLTLKVAFFDLNDESQWVVMGKWLDLLMSATGAKKGRLVHCPLPLDLKYGSRDLFTSPLKEIDGEVVYTIN